jgi:hypothetical protein
MTIGSPKAWFGDGVIIGHADEVRVVELGINGGFSHAAHPLKLTAMKLFAPGIRK